MMASAISSGDLLINGALLPELWRAPSPGQPVVCPLARQTFAACRWKVRYAAPEGGTITQSRNPDVPPDSGVDASVSLRAGGEAVTQTVFFGQRIEAAAAIGYRRRLVFAAWVFIGGSGEVSVALHAATPHEADVFGGPFGDWLEDRAVERVVVPRGRWTLLDIPLDARAFPSTGLSVELAFPPVVFPGEVRLAQLRLGAGDRPAPDPRPPAIETMLARRFFQRHDSTRINSLGRALVVNAHELHFQFTFPEMRAFPACTLPHSEEGLRVFNLEGIAQSGFRYDVTYRSRGSVIIRATRENHGLTDGFLSFVGTSAAILLDAEL
jgi:hypothetical protein